MCTRRAALGLSQVAFAARLGISPSYVSQMERGIVPGRGRLYEIIQVLGDDPGPWFAAAGYTDSAPAPTAKHVPDYGTIHSGALPDVIEIRLLIDRQTGRISVTPVAAPAPVSVPGEGPSGEPKRMLSKRRPRTRR